MPQLLPTPGYEYPVESTEALATPENVMVRCSEMRFRSLIICWALRFQRPPFLWLYRFYYWMAIQCSRILISRIREVRSIYLTGSWALQDVTYGVSDIDFKILVDGSKRPNIGQSIHRRFSMLRRFFPILGPPDEKGIYFLDCFSEDYLHHPLIQHLFDPRFFQHRLLWGEDLLPNLPIKEWRDLDQGECAFGRLRDWIERIHLLADYPLFSREQKQHLYFKGISDVARLALLAGDPDLQFSKRLDVLQTVTPFMEESNRGLIGNLILEKKEFYRHQRNNHEENFILFGRMVAFCVERITAQDPADSLPLPSGFHAASNIPRDPKIIAALEKCSPKISSVAAIRWPHLPLNPFDLHCLNSPAYVVSCNEPLGQNEFHALKTFYRKDLKNDAVLLIREYANFLSSADSELVDHWAGFSGSSDLLHLLVSDAPIALTKTLHHRIETRLQTFREQMESVLADPEYPRMDPAIFPYFFFNAARVLIFAHEFQLGRWGWTVTPEAVADYVISETPLQPSFIHKLYEQCKFAMDNRVFIDERLLPKARAILSEMLAAVQSGESWDGLSKLNALADEKRFAISLAIVTSNRPVELRRCLESLAYLVRVPDELIVVNDAGDSETKRIVEQSGLRFPVHYLEHASHGVASARNLAVRSSKSEIIAFVDDDACLTPDWLDRIERTFLRDPRIGLAAGSTLNMDCGRRDLIWKFMETVEKI
jgi:hypothetical protein